MIIRKEQIGVFEKAAVRNFEGRMVEYLKENFPKPYQYLGEERIRSIIQYGLQQANGYGLTSERNVGLYINLIFTLGSYFDTDSQFPWAAEILKDQTTSHEVVRMDLLYDRAMDYYDRVIGANREYLDEALRRIQQEPLDSWQEPSGEFVNHMVKRLNRIYPEKCQYLGENSIRSLVLHGIGSARKHGITMDRGFVVYIGMVFMLGSGFDTDPQFPWAALILNDESIIDQNQKIDHLYTEVITRLKESLA